MSNGRFGWHSGNLKAKNVQSGTVDITTDGAGDGTTTVTFKNPMSGLPNIVLTAREGDTTGTLSVTNITPQGFDANVDGSSIISGTLTVTWFAHYDIS